MVQRKKLKQQKIKKSLLKVTLQIGKNGLTEGVINEIKHQLKKKNIIKIRMLKSFIKNSEMNRRDLAKFVAKVVNAELVEVRGYTIILREKEW